MLLVLALMLTGSTALASSVSVSVNSSDARLYRSNSTSSASVGLSKGVTLTLKDTSGSWGKVSYKGVTGYVPLKYLNAKTRYAAYISKDTYIYKSASATSDRKSISVNTKVYVVGKSGDYYRVQNSSGSMTGYVSDSCLSKSKKSASKTSWKSKVVKLDWFNGGSSVLKTGGYGYIYDIDTGISLRIKRMGGHNHADVEPATASDTAKLKKIAGGSFSWDSHAVILYAGGKYVACAINTMPHGDQTISGNGYDGQFCLHMVNSLTHDTETVNENHQAAITMSLR
ncbi:MAG: SH3 domain-containing protein [Clostridia bacterium]|nr:SH3 domain-containing protein [Clostridia bacterium]